MTTELNRDVRYFAYEGADLIGRFQDRAEAEEAIEAAREEAGPLAPRRIYRIEARWALGGE